MTDTPDQLSEALRKIAKRGLFSHLSVTCSGGDFEATFRGVTTSGLQFGKHADPVEAILRALTGRGSIRTRAVAPAPAEQSADDIEDLLG